MTLTLGPGGKDIRVGPLANSTTLPAPPATGPPVLTAMRSTYAPSSHPAADSGEPHEPIPEATAATATTPSP
jgi:hypothetical protein